MGNVNPTYMFGVHIAHSLVFCVVFYKHVSGVHIAHSLVFCVVFYKHVSGVHITHSLVFCVVLRMGNVNPTYMFVKYYTEN
jgi:hypothetical protein